jgi:hypothetical protein
MGLDEHAAERYKWANASGDLNKSRPVSLHIPFQ